MMEAFSALVGWIYDRVLQKYSYEDFYGCDNEARPGRTLNLNKWPIRQFDIILCKTSCQMISLH